MKRHRQAHDGAPPFERDDERRSHTSLMALALFAGVVAGAKLAQSWYLQEQAQRRRERHDRVLERWEDEGGALPGTVGTGGAANPAPRP